MPSRRAQVRITDFGLAKDAMELDDKTHTFCGTPDYLAPEVIKGEGHGRGVDWWSLGTMIYEMLGGLPPFYSENFNVMYERILRAPLEFRPAEVFKPEAKDLIAGMLQKEPELRTGSSEEDGNELRRHPWFAPIDWAKLEKRELPTPFKPNVTSEVRRPATPSDAYAYARARPGASCLPVAPHDSVSVTRAVCARLRSWMCPISMTSSRRRLSSRSCPI